MWTVAQGQVEDGSSFICPQEDVNGASSEPLAIYIPLKTEGGERQEYLGFLVLLFQEIKGEAEDFGLVSAFCVP